MSASGKPQQTVTSNVEDTEPSDDPVLRQFREVRRFTHLLCEPLETEDYVVQTIDDVSPTKWHLAHTTWFFETFVLSPHYPGYESPDPRYKFLFNSYYNAVGDMHYRPHRGFISRPTVEQVFDYRSHVDEHMAVLRQRISAEQWDSICPVIEVGIHHEQQHQELMVTDIKHVLSCNPLYPVYRANAARPRTATVVPDLELLSYDGGLRRVGHDGSGFAYDNESPRHETFLHNFLIASRLTTNAEFLEFIEDGGYQRPEFWLSDGWKAVGERGWRAPLYWQQEKDRWRVFTISGLGDIDASQPVTHLSYFEADAFARWAGHRLPTESEWETAAADVPIEGNFADDGIFQPATLVDDTAPSGPQQMFGDVWEWTQSPYTAYPGYKPPPGALGEYNGKFMCNQFVLRGGSCATTRSHVRRTYRNFFPADARWQFSGLRLASDGNV